MCTVQLVWVCSVLALTFLNDNLQFSQLFSPLTTNWSCQVFFHAAVDNNDGDDDDNDNDNDDCDDDDDNDNEATPIQVVLSGEVFLAQYF